MNNLTDKQEVVDFFQASKIDEMIKDGDFEETSKSSATKRWYRIKNNPYYNRK